MRRLGPPDKFVYSQLLVVTASMVTSPNDRNRAGLLLGCVDFLSAYSLHRDRFERPLRATNDRGADLEKMRHMY